MKPQDIFIKIADPFEKDQLIMDLVRQNPELKVKALNPRSDLFLVSPRTFSGTEVICKVLGTPMLTPGEDRLITQFTLGENKYVSQPWYKINRDILTLDFKSDIFRVQRRESFRLKIPSSFQASMRIETLRGKYKCELIDLSAGGCQIEVQKAWELKVGDIFHGTISAENRNEIYVEAVIRHRHERPSDAKNESVGLEFINQKEIVKNRMAALVMDLYRELFTNR